MSIFTSGKFTDLEDTQHTLITQLLRHLKKDLDPIQAGLLNLRNFRPDKIPNHTCWHLEKGSLKEPMVSSTLKNLTVLASQIY